MRKIVPWLVGVALFGAGALSGWALLAGHGGREEPGEDDEHRAPTTSHVARNAAGDTIVKLDDETQKRLGLRVGELKAESLKPEVVGYGALEVDPTAIFTLRAPVAGTLRAPSGRGWPRLGEVIADGGVVGLIEPRLSAVERADLASRLATAKGEVEEIKADLDAARHSYENKHQLNAQGRIVSDRAMEEALAKVKSDEARLGAARETVALVESALTATSGPAGPLPMALARGGEVVDVGAQADECVEAGHPILRVAQFDHLLARITIPGGESWSGPPGRARIAPMSMPGRMYDAEPTAVGASIDPKMQGRVLIFGLNAAGSSLRPGTAVQAFVSQPGDPVAGVVLPNESVIRHSGTTWVYVEQEPGKYSRRPALLERPVSGGWFTAHGFRAGERVVTTGAQSLLSAELKSQFEEAEEE